MHDAVSHAMYGRNREPDGLQRMVGFSIAAHAVLIVAIVLVPPRWFQRSLDNPHDAMFISLGPAPGPQSGGMTSISSRPVQKVMQDLPRVQPVRPPAQKTPEMTAPEPAPKVKPKPTPPVKEAPKEAKSKTPTQGAQAQPGRANADTGAQPNTLQGLSTGGAKGNGSPMNLTNFCCPDYVGDMVTRINSNWNSRQSAAGVTIMRFTIQRDGKITDIAVAQSSGYQMLDFLAQRALLAANPLPPLPAAYTNPTLVVNLNFEYQR
jgi:protein TonB